MSLGSIAFVQTGDIVRIKRLPKSRERTGLCCRAISQSKTTQKKPPLLRLIKVSDILITTDFDYDAGGAALSVFLTFWLDLCISIPASASECRDADGAGYDGI
jgi:hypothetical protein